MIRRFFSTLAIWVLTGLILYFLGGQGSVWLLTVMCVATQWEFYSLLEKMGRRPFKIFGTSLGVIMLLTPYYAEKIAGVPVEGIQTGVIAVTIVACCLRILSERKISERIETLGATTLGLIYIPFMLTFMVRILTLPGNDDQGLLLILWFVITTKFCDVGALVFGRIFGRHQMSPNTSPKKTWEGAIGGCLTSIVLGFVFTYLLQDQLPDNFTPLWGALFALPLSIISIISDLVESMIKRQADQKDSGAFIPGIGGAFDLTDSFILTAPTAFLLLQLVI
ncbi:phosphatidate cytidylyltransferase [Puniceicoccaceae bacterium K14]|nr:phosphatidate cytidylyltransferase [Puniceicoccaceae bacterium K14]